MFSVIIRHNQNISPVYLPDHISTATVSILSYLVPHFFMLLNNPFSAYNVLFLLFSWKNPSTFIHSTNIYWENA